MQTEHRKPRRTANACIPCRHSKIKCSGYEPCDNCRRRSIDCEFPQGVNKIVVSERYLRELERQVRHYQSSCNCHAPATTRSDPGAGYNGPPDAAVGAFDNAGSQSDTSLPAPHLTGYAQSIWTNPFTLPSTMENNTNKTKRNWIWLAPWSMWSFTARLTIMLTEKLYNEQPKDAPTLLETEVYPLRWNRCHPDEAPDISGLPSYDYALHLFNTAKFHLGQNYRLVDEERFVSRLQAFYQGDAARMAADDRLWFIQLLLILAFGTAFSLGSRNSKDPPGRKFFVRAISLMPDHTFLWKESLVAIEVLALAGLYLYSIDQRESAHIYVGQAVRIAQFEGLHTPLPEDQLGPETVNRCRNLWWTLYILDSHFSTSVGLPTTANESEIRTLIDPPSTCSHQEITLTLQVKLSRLLSSILATVYKSEKYQLGAFLDTTRSILHTLATHAQEVEKIIHVRFQNSVDRTPNGTRHVTLLYHQCVIVATRPLLLSVLKERLENLDNEREDWQGLLALTKTLISIGIKSANHTLQILSEDDGLLEVFLPYDLEYAYAAALHLAIANALFPRVPDGENYSAKAHYILDEMICRGNKIAELRKTELSHLEALFVDLAARVESQGLQPLQLCSPDTLAKPGLENGSSAQQQLQEEGLANNGGIMGSLIPPYTEALPAEVEMTSETEFLNEIGISSDEFFSIVDQIGNPDLSYSILDPSRVEHEP